MKHSNDKTTIAKLSGIELILLLCMLAAFAGGIGCIYFD